MTATAPTAERTTMNGKPVHTVPAKSILNLFSRFAEKLLCDGPTFSMGDACVYSCAFCYVPDMFRKLARVAELAREHGTAHAEMVIRRANALEILRGELVKKDGTPRFPDPADTRVIFSSPAVDVAGNMDLVRETVEACRLILTHTHWQIRLLSKSNLLPKVAEALEEFPELRARARVIYGVSTGTLDDELARVFEAGAPLVSKRLASLHWLQDHGFRTFGMICPSLPQFDYSEFARSMHEAIRAERCEHVWAEVINLRGESFVRTFNALAPTHPREAELLRVVMNDKAKWEAYARSTFEAHAPLYPAGKLRFLQYVDAHTVTWWAARQAEGAVIL